MNKKNILVLSVLSLVIIIYAIDYVMTQNMDEETANNYFILTAGIVFVMYSMMAIWVYMDAKKKVGVNGRISYISPAVWAICVLLIWIIFFPWYVIVRNDKTKYFKADKNKTSRKKHKR